MWVQMWVQMQPQCAERSVGPLSLNITWAVLGNIVGTMVHTLGRWLQAYDACMQASWSFSRAPPAEPSLAAAQGI